MQFKVKSSADPRKPVAYISSDGTLYLQARCNRNPDQRNAVLGSKFNPKHTVTINGTGEVSEMFDPRHDTPIYEGDTVEVTF